MSIPDDPRATKGITHEQRYHLCLKKQECPSMKQSELASWFKEKYNFPISQPTISHSLKRSAEILSGGLFTPGIEATRVRKRPVRHPELEQAIYQWVKSQQQLQGQQQQQRERELLFQCSNGSDGNDELRGYTKSFENAEPVTGPILLQQARRIASEMGIKDTVFCPGWLSRFKARIRHGPISIAANTAQDVSPTSSSKGHRVSSALPEAPIPSWITTVTGST
ncbi:hypothetical protein BGZ80_008023 [Entomortierella chlamydospora]|uniref:HTH CENPB-type domain-containing protein n=1 Tax=Entomortierella chlamydospora TaxID=101097 RepID=A0A9P6MYV0_9FUNG|nr:hypothetical protein BGZ80_008023 [Entomortierella chlamydospora]